MAMYHRVGFTEAQSSELWERWKKGEGLKSIGRAFGKRLLRQYFPKGARQLNERPRKTLDFQSPAERFSQCVAATG